MLLTIVSSDTADCRNAVAVAILSANICDWKAVLHSMYLSNCLEGLSTITDANCLNTVMQTLNHCPRLISTLVLLIVTTDWLPGASHIGCWASGPFRHLGQDIAIMFVQYINYYIWLVYCCIVKSSKAHTKLWLSNCRVGLSAINDANSLNNAMQALKRCPQFISRLVLSIVTADWFTCMVTTLFLWQFIVPQSLPFLAYLITVTTVYVSHTWYIYCNSNCASYCSHTH